MSRRVKEGAPVWAPPPNSHGVEISVECAPGLAEMEQVGAPLRIAKSTVDVEVRDTRGEVRRVQVYVTDGIVQDGRGERLQDIFRARPFIPVRYGKKLEFISGNHLSWIRMDVISALDELDPEAEQTDGSVFASVRMQLEDGSFIDGGLRYFLPQPSRRLVDYLTVLPQWVPLRTAEWLYLINRQRVVRVIPLDEV